jgi:hypothetical protein
MEKSAALKKGERGQSLLLTLAKRLETKLGLPIFNRSAIHCRFIGVRILDGPHYHGRLALADRPGSLRDNALPHTQFATAST